MTEVTQLKRWLFRKGDYASDNPVDKNYYYMAAKTEECRTGPAYSGFYADENPLAENRDRNFDNWKYVEVPHDYLSDAPIDPDQPGTLGMVERTNAWYIHDFTLTDEDSSKRICLFFEGHISLDLFWINAALVGFGELVVCYALGLPVMLVLERGNLSKKIF